MLTLNNAMKAAKLVLGNTLQELSVAFPLAYTLEIGIQNPVI